MLKQEIINYIKAELENGVNKEDITNSLINVGWETKDVQDSFDSVIIPAAPLVITSRSVDRLITEKDYPIQELWIIKSVLSSLPGLIVLVLLFFFPIYLSPEANFRLSFYIVAIVIFSIYRTIVMILERATFHYFIERQFLILRQGIISKQERHIPYGVIQNLFVNQDIFDRIFGLASLTIENAAQGAGAQLAPQEQKLFGMRIGNQRKRQVEMAGFYKNKVSIPGLMKKSAEDLKEIILQKMKENPVEDSQSGL